MERGYDEGRSLIERFPFVNHASGFMERGYDEGGREELTYGV